MILEGAHLVPGFLESIESDSAVVVPLLVTVDDEELHRSHFYLRAREARNARPGDRYLNAFKNIRRIQKYMISSATMRGVPIVSNYDLDATLSQIVDHIVERALETLERGAPVGPSDEKLLEKAVEVIDRQKGEGSAARETVP